MKTLESQRLADQFGRNLAYCRRKAKLPRKRLPVRASLHRTAVGQLERGERVARVDTLLKLAGALSIPPTARRAELGPRRHRDRNVQL